MLCKLVCLAGDCPASRARVYKFCHNLTRRIVPDVDRKIKDYDGSTEETQATDTLRSLLYKVYQGSMGNPKTDRPLRVFPVTKGHQGLRDWRGLGLQTLFQLLDVEPLNII